ncbi:MAG TPA: hypothetical protein VMU82_12270 [Acetobacteraceae bacterium]|nr:hypothetical protein [Acetobacteraceae bacterium]
MASHPPTRRAIIRCATLGAPLLLAACAIGESGPPQAFPPLRYNYLRPLRLNVAAIQIQSRYFSGPGQLDNLSPERPETALRQMAQDRLVAAGSSGSAVFVITDASLRMVRDEIVGNLAVRLDVRTSDGNRVGFAEARVSRSHTAPESTSTDALRAALYDMTKSLMDAMNVEFEYQLRRSLGEWLIGGPVGGGGTVAAPLAPSTVQQQNLPPPSAY